MVLVNNNVAYLLGYLAGDGCVRSYLTNGWKGHYVISITSKYKKVLIRLRELFNKEFNIQSKWNLRKGVNHKQGNTFYQLQVYCKKFYYQLKRRGTYGTKNWRVPNVVKRANKVIKANWLAGFYDAEGSKSKLITGKKTKYPCSFTRVRVSTINRKGMKDVQKLLLDFGIKVNITNDGITIVGNKEYGLNIYKKEHHNIFNKEIAKFSYRGIFNKNIG